MPCSGLVLKQKLAAVADAHPALIEEVRGTALMLGLKCRVPNTDVLAATRAEGLLLVGAGDNTVRLLPPLIIDEAEASEAMLRLDRALASLAAAQAAE
jgi:acetylornithine/N-succinyldiaminopimelate aminotransferase